MTDWKDRNEYGQTIKTLIDGLMKANETEEKIQNKLKISHAVAYLIQTLSALLNSERELEERIEELEKRAMIAKKNKITK